MFKKIKNNLHIALTVLLAVGLFYLGVQFGAAREIQNNFIPPAKGNELLDADMNLFWEAVRVIKDNYVNISEVKDEDLLYGAISGLLRSIGDPYTVFFEPSDAQRFEEDLTGVFGGIGAEIGIRENQLVVIAPLKNSPAEKAGLQASDKILRVDDRSTAGITIDESVKIIRGEPGTEVVLLISREGWNEAREFKVTRELITIPTLDWEMIDEALTGGEKIVHIELYNFSPNSVSRFREATLSALLRGATGIILDLRNNSGGYLDVSIDLAGWFLNRGDVVVKEQRRQGEERVFRASGNAALRNIPVAVLVNEGTASASEILAGALRDNRDVKLVGVQTFGKGTVQEVIHLRDDSIIKVSVSKWVTPAGTIINDEGLAPDFVVEVTSEDREAEKDPQLEKAIEVLLGEL